jgi:SAM-dependent methyltransferase
VSAAAFEARYRRNADPWRTLSDPGELAKLEHALALCGPGPFASALELGCGIGGLTARLAPRSRRLLALDGAPTAIAATAERLAPLPGARAVVADLPDGLPDGRFDLVVASEVLYYLAPAELDAAIGRLRGALVPGGRIVAVHWTGRAPDLLQSAAEVHAALRAAFALERSEPGPTYLAEVLVCS